MLNYGARAGSQVEVDALRVMDPDLVRLQMDEAVYGLIDETGSADAANVDASLLDVLNVKALDAEGEHHDAVGQILNDHVLLPFVLSFSLDDLRLICQVSDQQVVARVDACVVTLLRRGVCSWNGCGWLRLGCRSFSLLADECELLRGHCGILLLSKKFHVRPHISLIATEHARGNGVLVIVKHLPERHCLCMQAIEVGGDLLNRGTGWNNALPANRPRLQVSVGRIEVLIN